MTKQKGQNQFVQWMAPLLDCLRTFGGSGRPKEVLSWIRERASLPADILDAPLKSGQSRFYNQVHWARQYLVWQGLIDDSTRGVWKLTPVGWNTHLNEQSSREIVVTRAKARLVQPRLADLEQAATGQQELLPPAEQQEQNLLDVLKGLSARGFELICERLLREHGFEDVEITQQSRDGGIDGYGVLRLSPFVSVKVAFQAKKYKDKVTRPEVGEFRNALLGRAEKGVLITTGRFTPDAESEATRAGVIPIELIDGARLVELFEEAKLGVKAKQIFDIDYAFFDQFKT